MARVTFITYTGTEQSVDVQPGVSLMEGAVSNGVEGIDAKCGGNCYCGTCRVYIEPEWRERIGGPTEFESPVVETTGDANPAVRLSCQISVTADLDGLVVRLPEKQM